MAPSSLENSTFTVHPSRLAFYDPQMRFVTEPGAFGLAVGASATDLRSEAVVELTGVAESFRQRDVVATTVQVEKLA